MNSIEAVAIPNLSPIDSTNSKDICEKRVVYLINSIPGFGYRGGGAERNLERLVEGLDYYYPGLYDKTVLVVNEPDSNHPLSHQKTKYVGGMDLSPAIRWISKNRRDIDIVHMGDGYALRRYSQLIQLMMAWNKPLIARIASEDVAKAMLQMPRILALPYITMITRFISLSDEISSELLELGVKKKRIQQIDNGVDTSIFHPVKDCEKKTLRKQLLPGLNQNSVVYIYTGRVTNHKKKVGELLSSWEQSQLHTQGHALLLVGGLRNEGKNNGDALFAQYADQSTHSPTRGKFNTYWTGLVDTSDVARYLQASDVFVLPSTNEGFSNSLLEAMAVGLPPIVRKGVSGHSRVVSGQTGVYFDTNFRLSDALIQLTNPDDRKILGQNASRLIASSFSLESTVEQYHRLYQSL